MLTSAGSKIHVSTSIPISHSYSFVADAFSPEDETLAQLYTAYGRVLVIIDDNAYAIYGDTAKAYFTAHKIRATIKSFSITEDEKSIENLLAICDVFTEFDLVRREPPLLVGGGLLTDVAG